MAAKKRNEGGIYRPILLWVFRNGTPDPATGDLLFTQADLRKAAVELHLEAKNFPDLPYNLRSRSPLPQEIIDAGFTTIAIRGKGKYALVMAVDKVEVPPETEVVRVSTARVPIAIRDILRTDEQSILSAIRYLDLISTFIGHKAHHLQGHLRTTGGLGQQVEADDVWVGVRPDKSRVILPVEAKGPRERIGRHQMMSTVDAVLKKIPGFPVVPLAAQLEQSGLLLLIEFSFQLVEGKIASIQPTRFKRYRPVPRLPQWP
jgi:hypothetical protein